jgi:hypothetical protein
MRSPSERLSSLRLIRTHKTEQKEKEAEENVDQDAICQIENMMLTRVLVFLSFTMCAGVVFFHLACVCDVATDANVVFGQWIITPCTVLAICWGVTHGLYRLWIGERKPRCDCQAGALMVCYDADPRNSVACVSAANCVRHCCTMGYASAARCITDSLASVCARPAGVEAENPGGEAPPAHTEGLAVN